MKLSTVVLLVAAPLGICTVATADEVLDVVAPWEITGPDPSTSGYVFTRMQVSETLMEADDAGRPMAGLASAWQVDEQGLAWRFTLRSGVRFHDGSPLTAEAVAASLNHALAKPGVLRQAPITAIEADADTVVVRLASPYAPLWALLAHTSTQVLAPAAYDAEGNVTGVIGTGPYRIDEMSPPQRMSVRRFDDYWGTPPAVEQASYLAVSRGETRALMAESGDAEIVFTLDPASVGRLSRNTALGVHAVAIPRTMALKVNAGHPALAEADVRRALSLAIDRAGIAAGILRTPDAAAVQLLPPALGGWHDAALPPLAHDPDQAVVLLERHGWQRGDDGMLRRDGEPLRLSLRTFTDRPELPLVAAGVQDQLRRIGVEVEVVIGNAGDIPAGHADGTLELALMARNFGLIPDPLGSLMQDFGPEGGDWGAMNWSDAHLNEALASLLHTAELGAGADARQTVVAVLQDELPVIPVAWYQHTAAASERIDGFSVDPLERSYRLSDIRWAP